MEFWSKGLGKQTIELTLTKSESLKSEGTLCLKGNMHPCITRNDDPRCNAGPR